MKKIFFATLMLVYSFQLFAQTETLQVPAKRTSITVGLLEGGGSLVGADLETLISNKTGIQIGAGLTGFGGAINVHTKPAINSSYFSLMYWHQGIGNTYTQSVLGPAFVYRGKKWFTAQIGLGYVLERGPGFPSGFPKSPVILTYAIGAYFPI